MEGIMDGTVLPATLGVSSTCAWDYSEDTKGIQPVMSFVLFSSLSSTACGLLISLLLGKQKRKWRVLNPLKKKEKKRKRKGVALILKRGSEPANGTFLGTF